MDADTHPLRWRTLGLLSIAELLGMSLWFAASAVSAQLAATWALGPSETGWLTTIVQLGFVAGTAMSAMLNLADVIPSKRLFAASALAGAAVNAAILIAPSYESALALRFFTGFFLAGVYPPAMKMIATWFRNQRGLAIGTIVQNADEIVGEGTDQSNPRLVVDLGFDGRLVGQGGRIEAHDGAVRKASCDRSIGVVGGDDNVPMTCK